MDPEPTAGDLPHVLRAGRMTYVVDRARRGDVEAVVALLRDDDLGATREAVADEVHPYLRAFEEIDADPHQLLVVVRRADLAPGADAADGAEVAAASATERRTTDTDGPVVATLQLTFLRTLSRRGALRMQVEAVRVAGSERGAGLGRALLEWATDVGRARGAVLAQLTTDRRRDQAHRFYERLGWVDSHKGMKLDLT